MNRFTLAAALVLTTVTGAFAYDPFTANGTADIDARRANEIRRIEEGRRSGQLSHREYNYLMSQQRQIAHDERAAKRDGVVTPAERARLNAELNKASADIERLKHNQETAYNTRPWYRRWY